MNTGDPKTYQSLNTNRIQVGETWHEPHSVFIGVCPNSISYNEMIERVQRVLQANGFFAQVNISAPQGNIELVFPHRLAEEGVEVVSPEYNHFVENQGQLKVMRALKSILFDDKKDGDVAAPSKL